jgi:putative FmdB family regulatory protein
MPIYEYKCQDCGTKFEKLLRRSAETSDVLCPSCGQKHLTQEFSTFAAHANGAAAKSNEAPVPQRNVQQSGVLRPELEWLRPRQTSTWK